MFRPTVRVMLLLLLSACALHTSPAPSGSREVTVIPAVFVSDRIFGTPVTASGDAPVFLLDTGDRSRFFDAAIQQMRWHVDTVTTARGPRRAVPLPVFAPSKGVPSPMSLPIIGQRVLTGPPTDKFDTLMSARTAGQLGADWFADRIWTFDYASKRLLLHSAMPPRRAEDREIAFDYRTDTAGNILSPVPRIPVEVDGDTLILLFDTGATIWLTTRAMSMLRDGEPAERSWNLVRRARFEQWRARHPDWQVIDSANVINGSPIIRVPRVRIAGMDVGPVFFGTIGDPAPGGVMARNTWIDGTLGGSALRFFRITLNYPARIARFRPA